MKLLLAVLPTIVLTTYSQLMIRWRILDLASGASHSLAMPARTFAYLTDPYIVSAYTMTLFSGISWFFVLEKHPVTIAFPVYIGLLFCVVTLGSSLVLREAVSAQHLAGMALILLGIVLVSRASGAVG
jgi:multidrug transporter EmrE-like cation transporter